MMLDKVRCDYIQKSVWWYLTVLVETLAWPKHLKL